MLAGHHYKYEFARRVCGNLMCDDESIAKESSTNKDMFGLHGRPMNIDMQNRRTEMRKRPGLSVRGTKDEISRLMTQILTNRGVTVYNGVIYLPVSACVSKAAIVNILY